MLKNDLRSWVKSRPSAWPQRTKEERQSNTSFILETSVGSGSKTATDARKTLEHMCWKLLAAIANGILQHVKLMMLVAKDVRW